MFHFIYFFDIVATITISHRNLIDLIRHWNSTIVPYIEIHRLTKNAWLWSVSVFTPGGQTKVAHITSSRAGALAVASLDSEFETRWPAPQN